MNITLYGNHNSRNVWLNGEFLSPTKSQAVFNHSPDGFAWGYSGSGPAQLALAVLLEFTDAETAQLLHQYFKTQFIETLPHDDFEIQLEIDSWIKSKLEELKDERKGRD